MRIAVDTSTVKKTRWHELLVRFFLGGLITTAAGIIGKKYGAGFGGLFLAFPVIFPASATLIEKHEKEKKERIGLHGAKRARQLVAADAAGAAIGSIGLFAFALLISKTVTIYPAWLVISAATVLWITISILFWHIRKRM